MNEIAAEGHSCITTAAERTRRENTWVFVLNSSGPNDPMNQLEDYQEAKRIKERLFQESGQKKDFIPGSKFDSDHINHSLGTMKALSASTQRQAGGGTTRIHQEALLPRDGNRLRGGNLLRGGKHQAGVNNEISYKPRVKVFRLQDMAIPM